MVYLNKYPIGVGIKMTMALLSQSPLHVSTELISDCSYPDLSHALTRSLAGRIPKAHNLIKSSGGCRRLSLSLGRDATEPYSRLYYPFIFYRRLVHSGRIAGKLLYFTIHP